MEASETLGLPMEYKYGKFYFENDVPSQTQRYLNDKSNPLPKFLSMFSSKDFRSLAMTSKVINSHYSAYLTKFNEKMPALDKATNEPLYVKILKEKFDEVKDRYANIYIAANLGEAAYLNANLRSLGFVHSFHDDRVNILKKALVRGNFNTIDPKKTPKKRKKNQDCSDINQIVGLYSHYDIRDILDKFHGCEMQQEELPQKSVKFN